MSVITLEELRELKRLKDTLPALMAAAREWRTAVGRGVECGLRNPNFFSPITTENREEGDANPIGALSGAA
jgi:hypothetical protein